MLELSDILLQYKYKGKKKYKGLLRTAAQLFLLIIQVTPFRNLVHKQLSQKCV